MHAASEGPRTARTLIARMMLAISWIGYCLGSIEPTSRCCAQTSKSRERSASESTEVIDFSQLKIVSPDRVDANVEFVDWSKLETQPPVPVVETIPSPVPTLELSLPNDVQLIESNPQLQGSSNVPNPPVTLTDHASSNGPWWNDIVTGANATELAGIPIDLDRLFLMTVKHSGRVLAVEQTKWISLSQIDQARAAFDPTLYSDNRFDSSSDPAESTLVTGGPPRLEDNIFGMEMGLRGQSENGTEYAIGQRFGTKNSNSTFFLPNNQGNSRLTATMTKPLLSGRHINLNKSLVLTAKFDSMRARAEYVLTLQEQLAKVAETYWLLYSERAGRLQRQQHLVRAKEIADLLASRQSHDASYSQLLRARAAVTNRTAELAQVDAKIRNLESRLRALVNAPELLTNRETPFVPVQPAVLFPLDFDMQAEIKQAWLKRPEIMDLVSRQQSVNVQLALARDQTKPTLNLIGEGYLAGLQANNNFGRAFTDQFSQGRPGYAAGIIYERPAGNRAAKAAVKQHSLELAQIDHLIREAEENIRAEVESAIRNVQAAEQSAISRKQSLSAVQEEVAYLYDRWSVLGTDPNLGQVQLNELLLAQDRLLQEEQQLLQSLVQYNMAILEVQRATGVIVMIHPEAITQ